MVAIIQVVSITPCIQTSLEKYNISCFKQEEGRGHFSVEWMWRIPGCLRVCWRWQGVCVWQKKKGEYACGVVRSVCWRWQGARVWWGVCVGGAKVRVCGEECVLEVTRCALCIGDDKVCTVCWRWQDVHCVLEVTRCALCVGEDTVHCVLEMTRCALCVGGDKVCTVC